MAAEEVELLVGVEAALALEHDLHGAEAPRPEQRRDPGGPRPLPHPVEALALLHLVAELELLVGEDVAVRVDDALGQPGGAGRVVELRRVVGARVEGLVLGRVAVEQAVVEDRAGSSCVEARRVGLVGDEDLRAGVGQAVADAVVAVEDGHRQQQRAELPRAEEDRRGLRRRRQHHRDAVAALHPGRGQRVRRLGGQRLELAPVHVAPRPVEALPDHRELVGRVLVADVGRDVVALGHAPL